MTPDEIHKLTDDELNVKCAEGMGWELRGASLIMPAEDAPGNIVYDGCSWKPSTDYTPALEDEIERRGFHAQGKYVSALCKAIDPRNEISGSGTWHWCYIRATPRQRAEAFAACTEKSDES